VRQFHSNEFSYRRNDSEKHIRVHLDGRGRKWRRAQQRQQYQQLQQHRGNCKRYSELTHLNENRRATQCRTSSLLHDSFLLQCGAWLAD